MSELLNLMSTSPKKTSVDCFKTEGRNTSRSTNFFTKKNDNAFGKVLSKKAEQNVEVPNLLEVDNSKALEQLSFLGNLNKQNKNISQENLETLQKAVVEEPKLETNPELNLLIAPLLTLAKVTISEKQNSEKDNSVSLPAKESKPENSVEQALAASLIVGNEVIVSTVIPIETVLTAEIEVAPMVEQTLVMNAVEPEIKVATQENSLTNNPKKVLDVNLADVKFGESLLAAEPMLAKTSISTKEVQQLEIQPQVLLETNPGEQTTTAKQLALTKEQELASTLAEVLLSKMEVENSPTVAKPQINVNILQNKVAVEQQIKNSKNLEEQVASPKPVVTSLETVQVGTQTTNTNQESTANLSQSNFAGVLEKTQVTTTQDNFKTNLENLPVANTVEITEDKLMVARQLVENIRLVQKDGNTEMLIRMKPEHLGEMVLKISIVNGNVNANFHTNNAEARGILEAAMPQLRQELSHSGFKVHDVGVYAGLGEFMSKKDGQASLPNSQKQKQPNLQKINNVNLTETEIKQLEEQGLRTPDGIDYKI